MLKKKKNTNFFDFNQIKKKNCSLDTAMLPIVKQYHRECRKYNFIQFHKHPSHYIIIYKYDNNESRLNYYTSLKS